MKRYIQRAILYSNRFLNQPVTIVIVLILLFIYFAIGNSKFDQQNRDILNDTHHTVDQTKAIAEDTKDIIKNLESAVTDLKADNARQTLIIQCLLVVHGESQFVTDDAAQACAKIEEDAQFLNPLPTQPNNTNSGTPNSNSSQSQPGDNKNNGGGNQDNSPGLVDRILNLVRGLLRRL